MRSYKKPATWRYLLEQTAGRCLRCGATENLTLDHVSPRRHRGRNRLANYQVLCFPCNKWKGAFTLDFRPAWMAERFERHSQRTGW